MQLEEAIRILREHEADLRKMGVRRLFVFGSTVRGEQRPDSDVETITTDRIVGWVSASVTRHRLAPRMVGYAGANPPYKK